MHEAFLRKSSSHTFSGVILGAENDYGCEFAKFCHLRGQNRGQRSSSAKFIFFQDLSYTTCTMHRLKQKHKILMHM